jgi:hypothetical protein
MAPRKMHRGRITLLRKIFTLYVRNIDLRVQLLLNSKDRKVKENKLK